MTGCATQSYFESGSNDQRAPAADELPEVVSFQSWDHLTDPELDSLMDQYHSKRKLRPDLKRALKISLHCGNQRCESDFNETPASCPLDCGRLTVAGSAVSISGYNMGTQCDQVQKVWEPKNLAETKALLAKLNQEGAKKIRFLGTRHSASSLICSDEHVILTTHLNRILKMNLHDKTQPTVEVEAGARLGQVWDSVQKRGYSLGLGYPFLRSATIGGMLSTGSHGSAHGRYGVSSQNILELTLLLADGTEQVISPKDGDLFKAATVSLGNMGLIYKFKLRIEPEFNLHATLADFPTKNFIDRDQKKVNWGTPCDFDTIAWFFGADKAVKICWNKTTAPAEPGAENVMLVHDVSGLRGKAAKRLMHYGKVYPWMNQLVTSLRYQQVMKDSVFVKKNAEGKEIRSPSVIGGSSKMLLSRDVPGTNPLFNIHDISFAIPEENAFAALAFIESFAEQKKLTMPMTGTMLRFTESDGSSFLSHVEQHGPNKRYLMADFFEYRYFNMPQNLQDQLNADRALLFKQLMNQFAAIPHGAKNDDWIFKYAIDQKVYSAENYQRYFKIRDQIDPNRLFINPYFDEFRKVVGGR